MAKAAVAVFVFMVAARWPVASFDVLETSSATEMATWAGHTGHQSRGGSGSNSHQGAAVGERHRSFGRQRVSRSPVVGISTPRSPPSSPRAAFGDSSRRVSSFHPTFSQSSDADGAGAGSRTEGFGRRSGAVDQIARRYDESFFPRAHAACGHASARSYIGRSSPIASSSCRDGGGERRVPQETCTVPLRSFTRHARSVGAKCGSVSASGEGQICSDGHLDRSRRDSRRKFEPLQPSGLKMSPWSQCRCSGVRSGARYGLRGQRVGEASHPGPPRLRILLGNEVPSTGDVSSTVAASPRALAPIAMHDSSEDDGENGSVSSTMTVITDGRIVSHVLMSMSHWRTLFQLDPSMYPCQRLTCRPNKCLGGCFWKHFVC